MSGPPFSLRESICRAVRSINSCLARRLGTMKLFTFVTTSSHSNHLVN